MTWLNLREDLRELFDEAQGLGREARQFTRATWWTVEVERRRVRREGFRLLASMARPLQARAVAPLVRETRWCPSCGGRHETTHSAESWKRWYKQVCTVRRKA